MQIIASGEPGLFKAVGFTCRFVRLPRRFAERGELSTDGVTAVDRLGLEVDVTTVERTIADPFDRHDLAGGAEELFDSLDLVTRVDAEALIHYAHARGNVAAVGALGFWLDCGRMRLGVPDRAGETPCAASLKHAMHPAQSRARDGRRRAGTSFSPLASPNVGSRDFELLRPPPRRCSPRDGYPPGAFEKVLRLLDPLREIVGDPILSGCRAPGRWRRRRPERLLRRPKGFEEKVDPVHRLRVGDSLLVPVRFPGARPAQAASGWTGQWVAPVALRAGFSPVRSSPASASRLSFRGSSWSLRSS